jgi:hypothetical protein
LLSFAVVVPALVYLFALAGFLGDSYARSDFPLDDAWIHRVYSRSFAHGHGFEYNDGKQEAGSTSPLWAVVSSPAHWFEGAGAKTVVVVVKVIGALLGLAAVIAVGRIGTRLGGTALAGGLGAALFALEPRLLFSSLSGMENVLLVALWTSALAAILDGRNLLSVILLSLAPVTRPEAIVLLPLALPALVEISRRRGLGSVAKFGAWAIPVVPILAWMLFCKATTGHLLPNTYYLKSHPFHLGGHELSVAWQSIFWNGLTTPWAYAAGIASFAVICYNAKNGRRVLRLASLVALPFVYQLAVAGSRSVVFEGYYWTRWLDPAAILLMVPFCVGFGVLLAALVHRPKKRAKRLGLAAGVLGAICLVSSVPSYVKSYGNRRHHLSSDSRAIRVLNVQTGEWIRDHTPPGVTVAVNDAGAIRYFGGRHTIDIMGLNNSDLAFGKVDGPGMMAGVQWFAIFPGWFQGTPLEPEIRGNFEPRKEFSIPFEEYTVCRNRSQTVVVIFERTRSVLESRP